MLPYLQGILHNVFTDPLGLAILGLILLVLGLVATLIYGGFFQADLRSRTWPSVRGKILSDRVEHRQNFDRQTHSYSNVYVPKVQYTFAVAGVAYTGSKVANRIFYSHNRKTFDTLKKRYPAGAEVMVYYDPKDPAQAVLEPASWSNLPNLILGMFMDAAGIVLLGLCLYHLIFK